ncbi:MAG: HyaD/HybD family hydrogenase maturation endopeptidase [Desulfuromonadaceae bacterium]|nr:HyaD/HybD family hydrogenase maturation endopeptidase [Desulfuromonadaceae bacterium]MDD2847792.1 HyaD/HybD family hydrogenase maturation endopeptidase [Desulfuromonadaceae bacterium]MDD4129663.1 HyaD/HybD family hydrogenase maturation endopeptidase [Desulfuromonadaceae bacterium]
MQTLVFGAGNLLCSDEGFGVHFIKYLEKHYLFEDDVELYDGGTLGIMVTHLLEDADRVFLIDVVDTAGEPGEVFRYEKEQILLGRLPIKMSPHQIGIQEVLTLSDLRGKTPDQVSLFGIIPASYEAGVELSPVLAGKLPELAELVVDELRAAGHKIVLNV